MVTRFGKKPTRPRSLNSLNNAESNDPTPGRVQSPASTTNQNTTMSTEEIIESRNNIARLALDGDDRYSHEAIRDEYGDINDMETEISLPRVWRAQSDSDVAVYSDGTRHILVADANGPIAITIL